MREVILVNADVVRVERGRRKPQEHWECPRAWARIRLEHSPIAWYPSRLAVAFHGEKVVIGKFLNEEERCALAEELEQTVRRENWPGSSG